MNGYHKFKSCNNKMNIQIIKLKYVIRWIIHKDTKYYWHLKQVNNLNTV